MTEFEQQVADALRAEILKVRELHSPEAPIAIAFALAPRVAAAIKAWHPDFPESEDDVLAALRGEA